MDFLGYKLIIFAFILITSPVLSVSHLQQNHVDKVTRRLMRYIIQIEKIINRILEYTLLFKKVGYTSV